MASYFDKICDIATEWTWDQLFPLSLKNVEKKQSSKTAWPRQGCRNKKPQKCFFWDTLYVPGCIFVLASP